MSSKPLRMVNFPLSTGILIVLMLSVACNGTADKSRTRALLTPSTSDFKEYENNPVIKYKDVLSTILWNDATVIKEGARYRMWLTGGEPFNVPIVVKVYEADSNDGIHWTIHPEPVLIPGKKGSWDDLRTETPSVVKVADTYHMYYSGCNTPCTPSAKGVYDIGHATSKDGTHWQKDSGNPVVKHHADPLKWGFYAAAEPAITYHKGTFFLYYASAKSNYPDYGTPFGIMLATSTDGSRFTEHGAVYTMTESYDPKKFRGYSTPAVMVSDGIFHLYHDVIYSPDNPDGFSQVALSYATSPDGFKFVEQATNIIAIESGWKNESVLAPSVLDDEGTTKLWFSAGTDSPAFGFGIGYATKNPD